MLTLLAAAAAGLVCGVLSGFGIGGGSLLMVWMTAVLSMEQRAAQGVNLLYFLPCAACALIFHIKNKQIVWRAVWPAALAGSVCAVGGALLAMFMNTIQAAQFKSSMTYEILLIVVLGGLGSVTGSCIASFLFIACSEWWLRGLDNGSFLGIESAMFRSGFRLVVFSVIIMVVVLFFRKGIMGQKELPDLFKRRKKAPAAAQAEGGAAK